MKKLAFVAITIAVWLTVLPGAAGARAWLSSSAPTAWIQVNSPSVSKSALAVRLQNHLNGILESKCQPTYTRNLAGTDLRVWAKRHLAAHRAKNICPARPPHYKQWLCIHHYEGAWNDPNPPYYGGLQMDLSFQRAHARHLLETKGTADHWTPLEQMWAAEDAWNDYVRQGHNGFEPWPNTARYCGLL